KGWQSRPGREVQFASSMIEARFTPERLLDSATGLGGAEVVSRSAAGVTRIHGDRIDLAFHAPAGAEQNQPGDALVQSKRRVQSEPAALAGRGQSESKVLHAENIKLIMRPGGEEVQNVETQSPGRLDLTPNQPSQWKRTLTAERMSIQYAAGNRPEVLQAKGSVRLNSTPPERPNRAKASAPAPP